MKKTWFAPLSEDEVESSADGGDNREKGSSDEWENGSDEEESEDEESGGDSDIVVSIEFVLYFQ